MTYETRIKNLEGKLVELAAVLKDAYLSEKNEKELRKIHQNISTLQNELLSVRSISSFAEADKDRVIQCHIIKEKDPEIETADSVAELAAENNKKIDILSRFRLFFSSPSEKRPSSDVDSLSKHKIR